MSFSFKITTSLFLAAAVAATPTPQNSITVGSTSAFFSRSSAPGSNDLVTSDSYARLVRRGDDDQQDGYSLSTRSTGRRAARHYNRASQDASSSGSDSDSGYGGSQRPAFSREVPSMRQLDYERSVARRFPGYSRLQRRSHGRSDYSDTSSDTSSNDDLDYGGSVDRRQDYDDDNYRRLVRRDHESSRRNRGKDYDTASSSSGDDDYRRLVRRDPAESRRNRFNDDDTASSSSGDDTNWPNYDHAIAPAHTPYADDYYEGVAGRGSRGSQRDYRRLARRDDYAVKESYGGDGGDDKKKKKKKKKKGDDSETSSASSSGSSSESESKKDKDKKDSDNDAYKSDDDDNAPVEYSQAANDGYKVTNDYQAANDYQATNGVQAVSDDYKVANDYQAANGVQAVSDDYKVANGVQAGNISYMRLVRRDDYPSRRRQRQSYDNSDDSSSDDDY